MTFIGIGLMMANALETNGAIVYIIGRRLEVLERAVKEKSVSGPLETVRCWLTVHLGIRKYHTNPRRYYVQRRSACHRRAGEEAEWLY